jgi:hypothetical protein
MTLTTTNRPKPPVRTTAAPAKSKPAAKAKGSGLFGFGGILKDTAYLPDRVPNPQADLQRRHNMLWLIRWQAWAVLGLFVLLLLATPFLKPAYRYYSLSPDDKITAELISLDVPNLTDQAITSWAANSITEIMTFGFGDIEQKLDRQLWRFTEDGRWSFIKAIDKENLLEEFRAKQLVLTTVPIDAAVITAQGLNEAKEQYWIVQLPVVMTYVTNNNVSRREKPIIELTIIRVPTWRNPQGIAIKTWTLAQPK